jgi:hypothetical protein
MCLVNARTTTSRLLRGNLRMSRQNVLRIVARNQPSSTPCSLRPSRASKNLPVRQTTSPPESLGNKLQTLAAISPSHVVSIELLVDHILASLVRDGRGLLVVALMAPLG